MNKKNRNSGAKRNRRRLRQRIALLMKSDNLLSECAAKNIAMIEKLLRRLRFLDAHRISKPIDRYNMPSILQGQQSAESVDTCVRSLQPVAVLKDQYGETEVYR